MFITSTGMVCPVGLNAASACAAKRAGISAFGDLTYLDNAGQPIIGATVPGLDYMLPRALRLLELMTEGLKDLLRGQPDLWWNQVPVLVCLAEPGRPGWRADFGQTIIEHLEEKLGVRFHPTYSLIFSSGHTAGFQALRVAQNLIYSSKVSACVVCGVDSFLDAATLLWLDQNFRLKTPANRDGMIPGEAAAAVLVQGQPADDTITELIGLGFGDEDAPILSGNPMLGRGLATAARFALAEARLGLDEIDFRLSDVTGELYGFKELPLMEGRLMRVVRKEAQPLWHWAEAIGDTGAAAGIAQLVLADHAFRKGYAPGRRAICLTSSSGPERAAVVVQNCQ